MKLKALLGTVLLAGIAVGCVRLADVGDNAERQYTPRQSTEATQDWDGAAELFKQLRMDPATGEIPWDKARIAKREAMARAESSTRSALGVTFEPFGPDNIGGRTRAILVDRNNSNRVYLGSVSGGLFYSDNAGGQWVQHPDWSGVDTYAPIISAIAQGADGAIYVGTGCTFDDDWPGEGIFKSTDGGATFEQISSTVPANLNSTGADWAYVNRIACDPENANRIYACTNSGFRMSNDGGQSWINPLWADAPCTFPFSGIGNDVVVADNGRVYVAIQGRIFSSTSGNDCTFERLDHANLPGSAGRIALALAPSDNNYLYGLYTTSGGFLQGLYQSQDGGETWDVVAEPIVDYFEMFGDNGQGIYDLAIAVSPLNPGSVIIGGVQLWRWDGNLTRIAGEFLPEFSFQYVHSDKHWFTFDPNNPNVLYIGSDGGVSKSMDGGENFFTANRGYQTTQNYGIAVAKWGPVLGGCQDNGTIVTFGVDPETGNYNIDGESVNGGDGFDCEISTLIAASFATSQEGFLGRQKEDGDYSGICGAFCENGPFHTRVRLWESDDDPTSKDTIIFDVDTIKAGIFVGNGTTKTIEGIVEPLQASAAFHSGSVKFIAGTEVLEIGTGSPVGDVISGNGSGTFNYETGEYSISFSVAPASNLAVFVEYTNDFDAGDVIEVFSNTGENELVVEHTLTAPLGPGDQVIIQDPIQTMLAYVTNAGLVVARGALEFGTDPTWLPISSVGGVTCMEFSPDGNNIYFGSGNGTVYRVSGLNDVYESGDELTVVQDNLFSSGSGIITGISLNPNNPEQLVVTIGGYGAGNKVRLLDGVSSGNATAISIAGDLPEMPVYDAEVLVNVDGNDHKCAIGTEFGVWVTEDYTAGSSTEWTNESKDLLSTPIYDIRQMKLGWKEASNHEELYLGTYGRGVWKTSHFVGTEDIEPIDFTTDDLNDLKVYPNPMSTAGTIEFELTGTEAIQVRVFDLTGKLVQELAKKAYTAGTNQVTIDAEQLPVGTYIATLTSDSQTKIARFVVHK